MAFATDPQFFMAYPLHFVNTDNPALMTFGNQQNHPVSFTGNGLLVCQLLVWDCPEHEYMVDRCHGHFSSLGACSFFKISFHKLLSRITTQHPTVTPRQERRLHS